MTTQEASAQDQWKTWHDNRNETLATQHGWLTLVAFTWIPDSPGSVDKFPGVWWVDSEGVHASFEAHDEVLRDGVLLEGEVNIALEDGDSDVSLSSGTCVAEVAVRGGRYAVRVRDSASPILKNFSGVPVYSYDPSMVVEGRFEPYEQTVDEEITTAHPGVAGKAYLVGEVTFELGGSQQKLKVQGDSSNLTAIFFDPTNGEETANWRFVSFARPAQGSDVVSIDFNRSLNFPAAFTPFGTCPMPPQNNEVKAPVRAGERRP